MHISATIKTAFEKRSIHVNLREGHHIIPIVVNKTRSCACNLLLLTFRTLHKRILLMIIRKLSEINTLSPFSITYRLLSSQ